MICMTELADSVMVPCGHGGICFQCSQHIIQENVDKYEPFVFNNIEFQNVNCHLCRKLCLKVYQLDMRYLQNQKSYKRGRVKQSGIRIPVINYINLIEDPFKVVKVNWNKKDEEEEIKDQ